MSLLLPGDWVVLPEENLVGVVKTVSKGFVYIWRSREPQSKRAGEGIPMYLDEEILFKHGHIHENAKEIPYLAERRERLLTGRNINGEIELSEVMKRRYNKFYED